MLLSWLPSPCVSVAPPSPEEPTESQTSHTHTLDGVGHGSSLHSGDPAPSLALVFQFMTYMQRQ